MKDPSWERAKQVFCEAVEKTGAERRRSVESACGNHSGLRAEVEALLQAHEGAGNFLSDVTVGPESGDRNGLSLPSHSRYPNEKERFLSLQSHLAGRYSFERELGRGGMGVVYLARDVSLDRPVAIKLLATDLGGRSDAREGFRREARISASLSHPNIVPVHTVEEHDDLLFFVMALIEGETVRERVVRTGPMAVENVSRMLQEVAWALDYAHCRGVIHRDIKPDNIILEMETGRAVVTDFGIARAGVSSGGTAAGALLGTPDYVSPEQALGNEVDGRSDIYSLGATCFFALTGRLPFEAQAIQGVRPRQVQEHPPPVALFRPDVPGTLARAVDRCLARDPGNRFGTGEELAEAASQARQQLREVPPALQAVRRKAELLVMDACGFGALSAMVGLEAFSPVPERYVPAASEFSEAISWGFRGGIWLLTFGVIASRSLAFTAGCREALGQGFSVAHLRSAIPGPETRVHRREGVGPLPPIMEASLLTAFLVGLGFDWPLYWGWTIMGWETGAGFLARLPVAICLVVLPVLVGWTFGERAVRRWPWSRRVWAGFWRGRVGMWIVAASGMGLRWVRDPSPVGRPTETVVAGAVADLYASLPPEYRSRLEEVPELVSRLESAAAELRAREAELGRALATVGTLEFSRAGQAGGGPGSADLEGPASVQAHRMKAAEDISAAQEVVGTRLSAAVAALESLRLGLLRLQSGVGSPDELDDDLKAAKEVSELTQALLDGEREVSTFLVGGSGSPGRSRSDARPRENRNEP